MTATIETVPESAPMTGMRPWLRILLLVVFAIAFGYEVWDAVANLITFQNFAAALGGSVSVRGWAIAIAAIVLPVIGYVAAWLLSRRCGAIAFALTFVAALAATSAITLSLYAFS